MQFALGLLAVFLAADPSDSAAAKTSIDRMRADLTYLSSTELEGRGIQTAGINKAAEHIRAEFKRLGLKSGTPDGTYFQPFEYGTKYNVDAVKTSFEVAGKKLVAGKDYAPMAGGGSAPFSGKLAFAGYGITVEGDKYDDYKGVDVAGKVVIVLRRSPRQGVMNDPVFGGNNQTRYSSLDSKIANATKHKAAGILFVNDPYTVKDASSDKLEDVNYLGRGRGNRIPVGQMTQAAADALFASSNLKSVVNAAALIEKDLKAQSMVLSDAGDVKGQFEFTLEKLQLKNVVGVIEGAGPTANETVVIGAHYDHVGYGQFGSLAPAKDRNRVHHGADDNGSGTTALMELARRYVSRGRPPGRRLVFIAFSAEESGLIGSKHYASEKPLFPIKDTAAMLNMDMVGRLRKGQLEIAGNKSAKEFEPMLEELNKTAKFEFKLGPQAIRGDSDHASFSNVGVPVLFFFTGTHPEYHRPTDTVELINFEGIYQVVNLAEAVVDRLTTMQKPTFIAPPKRGFALMGRGGARRASLGVMPSYAEGTDGVAVDGVREGTPAEKAGLKKGDVILEMGPEKIATAAALNDALAKFKPGDKIKLKFKRGSEVKTVDVELAAPGGGGPPKEEKKG